MQFLVLPSSSGTALLGISSLGVMTDAKKGISNVGVSKPGCTLSSDTKSLHRMPYDLPKATCNPQEQCNEKHLQNTLNM